MATPRDFLTILARAYTLAGTRPADDQEMADALSAAREMHRELGWQVVGVEYDGFVLNGEPTPIHEVDVARFWEVLDAAGIKELRFQEVVDPDLLLDFLRRLDPTRAPRGASASSRFRGLEEVMGLSYRRGDRTPLGMAGSVESLFGTEEGSGEGAEDAVEWEAPEEGSGAKTRLPPELRTLVESFLSASGREKPPLGEAIAAAAARLVEARDLGVVVDLVETLSEGSGSGARDRRALELATRLTSPGVASQLVARIGSSRDEAERERLIGISSGLGREMVLALADALGEARDRFQRRAFVDAMVAHGELAREMAERMVEDPRWYVVRNGVGLLAGLGGRGAVSHLTTTLANEDARVRKEAVLALAKVGGDDASMLLLGMLDDSEVEVRAKACWAVGVLKVERALRPLMRLLEKDPSEEVQVQCLHALGQIGDPGAVPLIERKAVVRLWSRPSKEVRMAAYRALAAIGTPHARALLLKATRDSDRDVRRVVLGLVT
jgi:HEAT repeat protein